jgi:glutaredoxin
MTIEIEILSAPGCTKCEKAKALVQRLVENAAQDFPGLSYRIIDLAESPEIGLKYGVLSTPAIVINGKLVFSGVPKEKALRKKLEST